MLTRTITGVIAAAVVLTLFTLPFPVPLLAVAALWLIAIYELGRAVKAKRDGILLVFTVNLAVSAILLPAGGYLLYLFRDIPTMLPNCFFDSAIGIAQVVLALSLLSAFSRGKGRILNYCWHSLIFITLPSCLLVFWSMMSIVNPLLMIIFFGVASANDTGAVAAGKLFGSRRIVPSISPGKTVEGIIGGFAAMTTFLVLVHLILKSTIRANGFMPLAHLDMTLPLTWILLLVVCAWFALVGFLGDITFSAIKRNAGIKDFGAILPGHGGILDRIDALLFIAPWYWFVLAVLNVANFR